MSGGEPFEGFPSIGRATAIPNLFFVGVLPRLRSNEALLAFLWMSKVVQSQRGEARFATPPQVWAEPGAAKSFKQLGGGRRGLDKGLRECVEAGALVPLKLTGQGGEQLVYFVNNPASRRAIARARSGALELVPESVVVTQPAAGDDERPGVFRLYEEHIGTITPMVGDRLIEAEEMYPLEWIEDAFREAAELNARNWRYIERILARWAEEGRSHETPERDSLEERKRKYLGGNLGHVVRYR